ncbi:MAG: PolC-type DNA polymerase III [Andreesenia angusta]|nr:PolC-type DNA polymerase III [Andreesenia angusta]
MESKKIFIKDIKFHNEAIFEKKLLDIEIDNIRIDKMKKDMNIYLLSDHIIENHEIENLRESFKNRFSYFNIVEINIRYRRKLCDCIEDYTDKIMDIINKTMPSYPGWSEDLDINVECQKINISVGSDIIYQRMKEEKLDSILMNRVNLEFVDPVTVNIYKEEKCFESKIEELKNGIEEEEKRISLQKQKEIIPSNTVTKAPVENNSFNNNWKKKSYNRRSRSYLKEVSGEITDINDLNINSGDVIIEGEIFDIKTVDLANKKKIYIVSITDYTSSIEFKIFLDSKQEEELSPVLKIKNNVRVNGSVEYDNYSRQLAVKVKNLQLIDKKNRMDNALEKRVELHCHTRMSSMDGMTGASELVNRAIEWGHKAIAITDHGVVQGFPEAMFAAEGKDIKIIYGVEGYFIDDLKDIVNNAESRTFDCEYTVFDIETTGFSARNDKIIEIGAVKLKDGKIVDKFSELINPERHIPDKIIELTGITDPMVENCETIDSILPKFIDFIGDSILVAHNADFDTSFIRTKLYELNNQRIDNPVLDTLELCRIVYSDLKNHKLNTIAKKLDISLQNHHRAVDDSVATANILLKTFDLLKESGIEDIESLNRYCKENYNIQKTRPNHIIILAKNQKGLKNLYKLISESHMNYFFKYPRIPKSLLNKYREGLLIGTACEAGELYSAILRNENLEFIENIASYYDYLEIQPISNNNFLIEKNQLRSIEELQNINRFIIDLGRRLDKIVIATGDVHFLDKNDEIFRRILMAGQGFSDSDNQAPLYFKTTDELLEEFSYLGDDLAREVVIDNPNIIADSIEKLRPIPEGTYPPEIEGADDELRRINYQRAREIYGEVLPEIVEARLERELNSIISNGYSVMYIIAEKLVKKSNEDGYLVGSRGSVGSSFVATMSGITEVNPLVPHYICPECKYSEFITDGSVGSGVDLPDAKCPKCNANLIKEGHDIPFEVFLGFEGDKEPDIDLNFAGEYQSNAHRYTEELFGEGYVFRAGTIGTIAEKTAYGFVKKYFESKEKIVNQAEINRLVKGCSGIKRTSGQHPGGVMVVPSYKDIYDFTPIQYPADDKDSGVITTHFDYNAISGRILKLDILGHDAPSIIKMLEDFTDVDSSKISLDDEDTKQIFLGTEILGVTPDEIGSEVGTYGIPEFGTNFVRQMLEDTRPTTFSELVRISGLSHGTDVWLNNAQDLVRNKTATLSEVICTRDDIMNYLIHSNLDKKHSFKIMENVRKGRGLSEEDEEEMINNDVPSWYIDSCKKIKYMFPKAHAVAYVMMSFRIAYFKVKYPEAFYATYFTMKAADFDAELILKGREAVLDKIKEIEALGKDKKAKDKNLLTVLEVCLEMYSRGYKFERVDLYNSDSDKFKIGKNGIIPPLKSLDGVGENVSRLIAKEREVKRFISIEDLTKRAKCSKTVIEALRIHGCLSNMQETNQIDLFSL